MYIRALNLLFVHLPKTGGESIVEVLAAHGLLGPKHVTWREFSLSQPALARQRPLVACFVRNPWDQALSLYSHLRKPKYLTREAISQHPEYFTAGGYLHPEAVSRSACEEAFPAWVARWYRQRRRHPVLAKLERWPSLRAALKREAPRDDGWYRHYRDDADKYLLPYLEWISAPGGDVRADFIGRFESLREDFAALMTRLGIGGELPHLNRSQRAHYHDAYDSASRQLIADYYAPEIARFGYRY
ncbi:MAG TPA: sulfotransferase family 2 domain-containing protein [Solimonas sp.]